MKNNRARGSRGPPAIHNTREGPFMTKSGLLFGAALALTVTAAAAEDLTVHPFFTADHIMQGCRGCVDPNSVRSPIEIEVGLCLGIIRGVASLGVSLSALPATRASAPALCLDIPYGPTIDQFVKVVVAYIEARPARMHEQFEGLTLEALRAACPRRSPQAYGASHAAPSAC